MPDLNPKQQQFVAEYLIDLNATQAAIRAGYSAKTAEVQGSRLLSNAKIADAVSRARAERSERTQITADMVLQRFWDVVEADTNELVEYRRTCCRFCYGHGYLYHRTPNEMAVAKAAWEDTPKKQRDPIFNEMGGIGWNARKPPNPDCPECFGEGHGHAHFKDTRFLSASAKRLYAGVKISKGGIEVSTLNPMDALVNVGKHLGMFSERTETPENEEQRVSRMRAEMDAMDASTTGGA